MRQREYLKKGIRRQALREPSQSVDRLAREVIGAAVEAITAVREARVISYLRAMRLELALLINFNVDLLRRGVKRIVCTFDRRPPD